MERDLVSLLQQLVRVPSVNPGHGGDPEFAGEQRMAEFTAEYLQRAGFSVELQSPEPGRPNVIGTSGPANAARTLLVEAHLDTVGVAGMCVDPFAAEIRQGRLYGRGACDMKGAMAAALHVLQPELLKRLSSNGWRTLFVGAMGEEGGNEGALELVRQGRLSADFCIVLEPTELAIVHAHKGALWTRVTLNGRAAHGSAPQEGRNAIAAAARLVEALSTEIEETASRMNHPALGPPTFNVGRIDGGGAVNVVAGRCVVDFDRRYLPGESGAQLVEDLRRRLREYEARGEIVGFELGVLKDSRPFETDTTTELVQRLSRACEASGVPPALRGTGWYSDAGPLAPVCREVVVFGPGSIRQAHTADEYIELDQLEKGADILRRFVMELN